LPGERRHSFREMQACFSNPSAYAHYIGAV
jgi:hypothetical protein